MIEYTSRLPEDKQVAALDGLELLGSSGFLQVLGIALIEEVARSMVAEEPDAESLRRLQIAHGVSVVLTRLHADATKLKADREASVIARQPGYESVLG